MFFTVRDLASFRSIPFDFATSIARAQLKHQHLPYTRFFNAQHIYIRWLCFFNNRFHPRNPYFFLFLITHPRPSRQAPLTNGMDLLFCHVLTDICFSLLIDILDRRVETDLENVSRHQHIYFENNVDQTLSIPGEQLNDSVPRDCKLHLSLKVSAERNVRERAC